MLNKEYRAIAVGLAKFDFDHHKDFGNKSLSHQAVSEVFNALHPTDAEQCAHIKRYEIMFDAYNEELARLHAAARTPLEVAKENHTQEALGAKLL
ncbi:hypothetical protein J4N45_10460 [Vibrio sp. SCSIO 43140]|uniref:hypothetical protein n=1 Tax=Vibrio sp. SCSIO 43140 TaxID=2819100 RepID=UPI002074ED95|nr:hypothetical protein [Vibrio sp. SCSIO 43140]USD58952.1 hypothetical protein J4N45_10460 [Vibrio sp. SCSIO 43140]